MADAWQVGDVRGQFTVLELKTVSDIPCARVRHKLANGRVVISTLPLDLLRERTKRH